MICADCPINSVAEYQAEIARLRQEVERLTKALDDCEYHVAALTQGSWHIGELERLLKAVLVPQ